MGDPILEGALTLRGAMKHPGLDGETSSHLGGQGIRIRRGLSPRLSLWRRSVVGGTIIIDIISSASINLTAISITISTLSKVVHSPINLCNPLCDHAS